ncbi:Tfp pilus assembly protein FimT/FimU [Anabaena sp. CCY 0017]|uniref:Tfp pilus assembly protein FimT/FimU n=1 Tax=Anabaena sp. CCY 0017 TaxID=3103866 RepID=UPI0039C71C25
MQIKLNNFHQNNQKYPIKISPRVNLSSLFKAKFILNNHDTSGFTLLEVLVVIFTIGILSAIAAPSWLGFLNRQKVNTAQSQALSLLRNAQSNAKREKLNWQVCFWDDGNQVLAATQIAPSNNQCQATNGQPLIQGDSTAIKFTSTFAQVPSGSGKYRVQFKYDGSVNGQLGRITFTPRNTNVSKRCVFVSTLIGAMRSEKDNGCGS